MKVVLSTPGKFHTFDLARELNAHGALAGIFTGYPRFKLRSEGIPQELIHTYPWVVVPYMAFPWKHLLPKVVAWQWEFLNAVPLGNWVAQNLPECDIYVGLSGSSLSAGKKAHQRGARYVCDRGSAHIRLQDSLLREEHVLWGMPFAGIDPRTIEREEAEYAEADLITVPSIFSFRSFIEQGIPAQKLSLLPYGVNVSRFKKVAEPADMQFDVLYVGAMSLQKGIQYLVQAYQKINHPNKSLTFVGAPSKKLMEMLKMRGLWPANVKVLGHVQQTELKKIMSRSHVLVLPSIQDGFGMVMAQAMACGCPVIASKNTGGEDLFSDGVEGLIVPIRDVDALTSRLQMLADDSQLRYVMGRRALARVNDLGGWSTYGKRALEIYSELIYK
jgi:glycosyltransferase involved in cell wall biosynthesis